MQKANGAPLAGQGPADWQLSGWDVEGGEWVGVSTRDGGGVEREGINRGAASSRAVQEGVSQLLRRRALPLSSRGVRSAVVLSLAPFLRVMGLRYY